MLKQEQNCGLRLAFSRFLSLYLAHNDNVYTRCKSAQRKENTNQRRRTRERERKALVFDAVFWWPALKCEHRTIRLHVEYIYRIRSHSTAIYRNCLKCLRIWVFVLVLVWVSCGHERDRLNVLIEINDYHGIFRVAASRSDPFSMAIVRLFPCSSDSLNRDLLHNFSTFAAYFFPVRSKPAEMWQQ